MCEAGTLNAKIPTLRAERRPETNALLPAFWSALLMGLKGKLVSQPAYGAAHRVHDLGVLTACPALVCRLSQESSTQHKWQPLELRLLRPCPAGSPDELDEGA